MKVYTNIDSVEIDRKTAVALGNFDGVHIGHRKILTEAGEVAREKDMMSICFTFSVHPREFRELSGGKTMKFLSEPSDKLELMSDLGIDAVVAIPFTREIMTMDPEAFVKDILVKKLNVGSVHCGFNYSFGDKASGNPELLKKLGSELGFEVHVQDPVTIDGETVSSTSIREIVEKGDMEKASQFLGRPFALNGQVSQGRHIGRTIGFPTANFSPDPHMVLPPNGVYFTSVKIFDREGRPELDEEGNEVILPGITNLGTKPTVGGKEMSVETYIYDFNQDIYGKEIRVYFLKWERPEKNFASLDELKAMIQKNCRDGRVFHGL